MDNEFQPKRNKPSAIVNTIESKYPFFVSHSKNNYYTGSVSATFMEFDYETCQWKLEHGYEYRKKLLDYLLDGDTKILKIGETGETFLIMVNETSEERLKDTGKKVATRKTTRSGQIYTETITVYEQDGITLMRSYDVKTEHLSNGSFRETINEIYPPPPRSLLAMTGKFRVGEYNVGQTSENLRGQYTSYCRGILRRVIMANTLQIKRGLESNLPRLAVGELAFTTDAGKFYVGDGTNNICLNDLGTAAKKDIGISTGNVVVVQSDGKIASVLMPDIQGLDASKLTGTISIERLPHGALERCVVVANDTARLALTAAQVQNGDTVKVTATGIMYFVMDETKLGQETAYQVYSAGTAATVAWSGVTAKPTTLAGFGITDAVSSIAPTFTESPTAPTPSSNDNSTKLATTAFVKEQGYLKEILSFDCGTF